MLLRPDFYLFGAAGDSGELNALVDDLREELQRHGVRAEAGAERAEALAA